MAYEQLAFFSNIILLLLLPNGIMMLLIHIMFGPGGFLGEGWVVCLSVETGSHYPSQGLRLTWNSVAQVSLKSTWSSCLSLPCARITGMCHTPGFVLESHYFKYQQAFHICHYTNIVLRSYLFCRREDGTGDWIQCLCIELYLQSFFFFFLETESYHNVQLPRLCSNLQSCCLPAYQSAEFIHMCHYTEIYNNAEKNISKLLIYANFYFFISLTNIQFLQYAKYHCSNCLIY